MSSMWIRGNSDDVLSAVTRGLELAQSLAEPSQRLRMLASRHVFLTRVANFSGALAAAAKRHGCTAAQLAIAWLLARSPVMLPIPGTGSLEHLEENMAAAKLKLSKDEWKKRLEPQAYKVLREEGTERAGTSPLNREKRAGTYVCAGCGQPLFKSEMKFDSGTGWPSFFRPLEGRLGTRTDYKLILPRTEYHCARCGGHQGHVFEDGPPPTGLRYCNNGVALRFVPAGETLPPLVTS